MVPPDHEPARPPAESAPDLPAAAAAAPPPLDLRLAFAALAVWLVTWFGLDQPARASFAIAAVAAAIALLGIALPVRGAAILALIAGCAAAAGLALGVRVGARDASPLAALARHRSFATLQVVVSDDPRPLRSGLAGRTEVLVSAHLRGARAAGRSWRLSGDVVVLAPKAGWSGLLPSQQVTVDGRLGTAQAGDLSVAAIFARGPPQQVGRPSLLQRGAGRVRAGLRQSSAGLPDGARGLLPGLVDGDVSGIDPALTDDFRTTGLTHLTAVSGANLSILAGAVLLLARWLRLGPRTSAVLAGCALVGFVILARPSPSVLRAAVMGGIALAALAGGRPRSALPSLAASVLALTFVSPALARSPGFAMSVAATAALVLVAPSWAQALRRRGVRPGFAEALAMPAAAHLASAPFVAAISGRVSLAAVPANVLAEPVVAPATVFGVVAAVVTPVSATAGRAAAWLAGWPARWIVGVARRGAAVPDAATGWPAGARGALLLAFVLYGGALLLRSRPVRRGAVAAAVGAGLVALPVRILAPAWPPPGWLFVACDVGQGDGLVLHAGAGTAVVVDTGPGPVPIDSCLRRLHIDHVALLITTHMDADHVDGITGVFDHRRVDAIAAGPLREPADGWHRVAAAAAAHGLTVQHPGPGARWQHGGLRLDVLGPLYAVHGSGSTSNNACLVVRATVGGHTILLTSDAGPEEEQALVHAGVDLRVDVLKVPHHGSAHDDPGFLAASGAHLAVVSVGAHNDYGQPAPALLTTLTRLHMPVDRTDLLGDVAVCERSGQLVTVGRARAPPG